MSKEQILRGEGRAGEARYIEQIAGELKAMATGSEMAFLAYLLAMVEDSAAASRGGPKQDAPN